LEIEAGNNRIDARREQHTMLNLPSKRRKSKVVVARSVVVKNRKKCEGEKTDSETLSDTLEFLGV